MADSNITSTADSLSAVQIIAVVLFNLVSIGGILAYFLVLFILVFYFKEFKSNFYFVVISLALPDVAFLFLILFYVVPSIVLKKRLGAPVDELASFLQASLFFVQEFHLIFIAANRLCYACASTLQPKRLDEIFNTKKAVAFWIAVLWLAAPLLEAPVKLAGCTEYFDWDALFFSFSCPNGTDPAIEERTLTINIVFANVIPQVLITTLHVSAWTVIRWKGKVKSPSQLQPGGEQAEQKRLLQQKKRERRILIQFTLISLLMNTYVASFWVAPLLLSNSLLGMVVTLLGILSSAVNPFTYLAFNKLMKKKAKWIVQVVLLKKNNPITPADREQGFGSSSNNQKRNARVK